MLTVEEMRNALLARQNNYSSGNSNSGNSKFFSFSNLKPGNRIKIRFVKDADDNNQFFWRNTSTRQLKFNGLMSGGKFYEGEIKVNVPAFTLKKNIVDTTIPEEYRYSSEKDPIQNKIQDLWNQGEEGQALYRAFKRKESFIYRGFVRQDNGESKFYYFSMSPKMQERIESFTSEQQIKAFPDLPIDENNGRDFVINVTSDSGRNSYTSSEYELVKTPLSEAEKEMLNDPENQKPLYTFCAKCPTLEEVEMLDAMYEAVANQQPFDFDAWGKNFKPRNAYKDSNGNIQIRNGGDYNSSNDEEEETATTSAPAATVSAVTPPTQITATQVNEAMTANTATINNSNVNDMVANLLAQFQQQ